MNKIEINDIENNSSFERIEISDTNFQDGVEVKNLKLNLSEIKKIGCKEVTIKYCELKQNFFRECYFRKTKFTKSDLTGCKFISCNFSKATFENSTLDYVSFENCAVNFEDIKDSLPKELNLKKEICKNLAMEHLKLGNTSQYKKFLFEEREVSRKYYLNIFKYTDNYIKKNYNNLDDRALGLVKYCLITFDKYLWGYGEKLSTIIKNIFLINIFCYIYFKFYLYKNSSTSIGIKDLIQNFFNISDGNLCLKYWSTTIHRIIGIFMCGILLAALFRRINKR